MIPFVFFLEEASAKAMLEGVLPRLLPNVTARYVVFEGKQDLERQLVRKMRLWQEDAHFIVMRDQDSGDCYQIKDRLLNLSREAGRLNALVRIACKELESFYLGDLNAVEQGLGLTGLARRQQVAKFRNPDSLNNAAEELKKITNKTYQKVSGSRAISPFLVLDDRHCSTSFKALINGLRHLVNNA
ncbi:TPA: DUF4276 family protein [Aeromonas salmonicida]|uniref:DUF4276 family protein n=1 Tax=Aeromonas salmonicida (strain A449) TaxID=382245 RepID=A4SMR1_AERS4|nr:DUF4276 family protein [Aeromonas salmonicida]ABO90183.1 conserved hypothetical protein [Aeromonas salmonicida subsp. salmonicida A449]EKP0241642.1 DUF4276 family protein [Aeromonas salmonicida]EKP0245742.1 DUF4276 family protein [Aeromonas salmonicida]EKP0254341.1 DUF4276 family protein [Aeromonas salmonicida]EKP0258520.1 DUF4276 family protein [Aeromonas salmonicida]